jgi:tetratricopeptide (TPR) repeat protein
VAIDIAGRILERKVWPALNESSVGEDAPFRPFARLACKPHPLADAATNAEVLEALLDAPAHPHDSHPSLRERLNALGATAELPGPPARSAADAIIGPMHSVIAAQLDADWDRRHGDAWRRRKRTLRRAASRLSELEAQTPGAEQSLERGALLEKLSREAEALEAYHSALKYDPDSGKAALGAGRLLLEKGESAGADLIQRSMELDVSLLPAACEILVGHYTSQRRFADAERCRARLTRYHTRAKLLQEACSTPRLPADL